MKFLLLQVCITSLKKPLSDAAGWEQTPCVETSVYSSVIPLTISLTTIYCSGDELSAQKALQTVEAGMKSENLLDFDSPADGDTGGLTGLAATDYSANSQAKTAAANLIAGTSSNPLDDLVSIFGSAGLASTPAVAPGDPMQTPPQTSLGIAGFSFGSGMGDFAVSPGIVPDTPTPQQPPAQQSQQDDLLGLF